MSDNVDAKSEAVAAGEPKKLGGVFRHKPFSMPEHRKAPDFFEQVTAVLERDAADAHDQKMRGFILREQRAKAILAELQAAEALENSLDFENDNNIEIAKLLRESVRTWA